MSRARDLVADGVCGACAYTTIALAAPPREQDHQQHEQANDGGAPGDQDGGF
ncbi:MAG: hypothetical protein HY825_16065 [Acidobacteria bacterium]|nr:hypothetical protein [Acidobacteriota bacterium]